MNTPLMPILFKEFRTQLRGNRAALLLTLYVGLLLIALGLLYRSVVGQVDFGAPLVSAQIGQALFTGLALATQGLTIYLAPATTVNAISGEHERRTFDMLLKTPLSASQVLLGKLLAALAFVLLLLVAALPLFSVVVLFGGVEMWDISRVLVTVLLSAIMGSLLGLFCSVVTRQTYAATLICYAILTAVIGGTLFAANLWSITHSMQPAPPEYVLINPLSAIASALASARPPEVITTGTLRPLAMLSLLTQGTLIRSGSDITVLPLYRATWLLYGGITLLLFWASLYGVQPRRRWRVSRIDALLLLLFLGYLGIAWLSRTWWLAGLVPPADEQAIHAVVIAAQSTPNPW